MSRVIVGNLVLNSEDLIEEIDCEAPNVNSNDNSTVADAIREGNNILSRSHRESRERSIFGNTSSGVWVNDSDLWENEYASSDIRVHAAPEPTGYWNAVMGMGETEASPTPENNMENLCAELQRAVRTTLLSQRLTNSNAGREVVLRQIDDAIRSSGIQDRYVDSIGLIDDINITIEPSDRDPTMVEANISINLHNAVDNIHATVVV